MKKTYTTPIMMIEQLRMRNSILDTSKPHINDEGNAEFPGGEGEGGDADEGCVKEFNEIETDPFKDGLW